MGAKKEISLGFLVEDEITGTPIPNAILWAKSSLKLSKSVTTDYSGIASITIPVSDYSDSITVMIAKEGFETTAINIIPQNEGRFAIVALQRNTQ